MTLQQLLSVAILFVCVYAIVLACIVEEGP